MLINDVVALLLDVPPVLAAQWGAWFVVGLALSIWTRREKARLVVVRPAPRQRSAIAQPEARPARTVSHAPLSADAFGELEALFNEVEAGSRRPGEARVSEPPAPEMAVLRRAE